LSYIPLVVPKFIVETLRRRDNNTSMVSYRIREIKYS
jgi:hypothetical protein